MKEFGMYIQRLIFSDKMENLLSVCVRLLLTVIIGPDNHQDNNEDNEKVP